MGTYGYDFYFKIGDEVLTLPVTPSSLNIQIGSKNETVTLINQGDINILKSPSLVEVNFDARFPMRKYPYSRNPRAFEYYHNTFKELKEQKKPFRFIVVRTTPSGTPLWDTNLLMALENYELDEDASEGDDVIITFTLKQYKEYGVKTIKLPASKPTTTSTSNKPRNNENKAASATVYVVKSGDCLWNIAKKFYGNGNNWKKIYTANKSAIEADAKKHGKKSSSNGHWIWPGLKLTIPPK